MIGEIGTGSSFRGLNHYLLHGSAETGPREPTWAELRNLAVRDPDRAHREMRATARQNSRAGKPVFHVIVSPAPEDQLSREQWSALADRVLSGLGLDEHQALVVHHSDTDVPHLHLAVNRIHPEHLVAWETWRSKTRLEAILRKVERDWGLRRVEGRLARGDRPDGRDAQSRDSQAPTPRPIRAQVRHRATEPQLLAWRKSLNPHFHAASSWSDLAVRLEANGVRFDARGRGMVVTDGSVYVKASSLDRSFSRGRLEERFGQTLSAWRDDRERFASAATVYSSYAHHPPSHPRAHASLVTLRAAGKALGWRAAARLSGPLTPAVGAVVAAARARDLRHRRASGGGQASLERTWRSLVERSLVPALRRSTSWAEAEGRLRFHGAWIGPEPGGDRSARPPSRHAAPSTLVVTDGVHSTPLARLAPDLQPDRLTDRLGSWSTWQATRDELLSRARRLQRYDATLELRTERWHRLLHLAQQAELRVERHRALRADLEATEDRLRAQLRPYLPRESSPTRLTRLVRDLRTLPEGEITARLDAERATGRNRFLPRLGRQTRLPDDLRHTLRDYRRLTRDVARVAPSARSAARRLTQIRRRARLLNPRESRQPLRRALLKVARRVAGVGLRSLLSQAAPGLGQALTLVRLVRGVGRQLERAGRER